VREPGEIKTRGGRHPPALRPCDARRRAAEIAPPSQPHFDEYQELAIAGHEIELAHAAAPVPLDDDKALAGQELSGQRFGRSAFPRAQGQGEPAGTIWPPLN
jgi:hypothetical protein